MGKYCGNMVSAHQLEWAVTSEKVQMAIQRIVEVASARKVIVFGSFAKGATTTNSDFDVLVITEHDVSSARKESVRIRRLLRGISMPMDIIVLPEAKWIQVRDCPGTIYKEILRTGKVVYES